MEWKLCFFMDVITGVVMKKFYNFMHLRFDVKLAKDIAKDYRRIYRKPNSDWLNPTDNSKYLNAKERVIFVNIPMGGQIQELLISGQGQVIKNVKSNTEFIPVTILDVRDSLKVLCCVRDEDQNNIILEAQKQKIL